MRAARSRLNAQLRSANKPSEAQLQRFEQFLTRTYKRKVPLRWEFDESLPDGFRLQVGSDIYDWTLDGRARQFADYLRQIHPGHNDIIPLIREAVEEWAPTPTPEEIGEVLTVDGDIATVGGLAHAQYGEILLFSIFFVIVALLGKIIGCGLMAKLCKFKNIDCMKVGVGMMTRGEVALIVSQKGLSVGLLTPIYFTSVILLIIVSSISTPIILKLLYAKDGSREKMAV